MNKILKKSIATTLIVTVIATNSVGVSSVFADANGKSNNTIGYESQEIQTVEVESREGVESRAAAKKGKKKSSNWKGGWFEFFGTLSQLLSLKEDLKYLKDSFDSIRLEFKVYWKANVEVPTWLKSTWVGTGSANNSKYVKIVQEALNKEYSGTKTPLDVDGSAGPKTVARIKEFQKANGLNVDGSMGRDSYKKLFRLTSQ